jgi:putative lipoic acid-binding regulatory protein
MSDTDSLLQFPCDLPVKVFGRNDAPFRQAALAIVERHFGEAGTENVSEQLSRREAYASLTIVVRAESREQIDALYRELTSSADILMVL